MSRKSSDVPILTDYKDFSYGFPAITMSWVHKYQPNKELHYHNCLEIGYVVEGSGEEMIGNQLYSFEKNSLSVIQQGCIHDSHINLKSVEESGSTWKFIFASPEELGISYEDFGGYITKDANMLALFHMMYDELENKSKEYEKTFFSLLSCFLIYAKRMAPQNTSASVLSFPYEIAKAIQKIHSFSSESLSIPQLAAECNMSVSSFTRAFRHYFGISPLTYIHDIRLSAAQHMIQNTDMPIESISAAVGFNTLSSFNRLYKKKYNISPSGMRKNYKR